MASASRQLAGLACEECRRRKLRCDRKQPQCSVCEESGAVCHFNRARSQRGPKRGHLKALRSRIASLEGLLGQEGAELNNVDVLENSDICQYVSSEEDVRKAISKQLKFDFGNRNTDKQGEKPLRTTQSPLKASSSNPSTIIAEPELSEMIRADLDQLYFERIHPVLPIVHQCRYLSWARQDTKSNPRACLQLSMWTLAASVSANFQHLLEPLSACARTKAEALDVEDQTMDDSPVEQAQAWLLITQFELRYLPYRRAWITAGRAFRLIQMFKFHQLDPNNAGVTMVPEAWLECEEKRRTFWLAYCMDRFISVRSQRPLTIQEETIWTRLPAPESDFQHSRPVLMDFLSTLIASSGQSMLPPFAESIVLITLCGRSLSYMQPSSIEDLYSTEVSTDGWARQKWLYQMVQKRLSLLSLPASSTEFLDPMRLFTNMLAHAALIWLCNSIESRGRGQDKMIFFMPIDRYCVLQSACEIVDLAKVLTRSSFLKAHVFSPMVLFLAANFLKADRDSEDCSSLMDDDRQGKIDALSQALQILGNGNILAMNYLQLLETGCGEDSCKLSAMQTPQKPENPSPFTELTVANVMDPFFLLDGQIENFEF